jgi:hypothetical protein
MNSAAFFTFQCEQFGLAPYGPRAFACISSANRSDYILIYSYRVQSLPSRMYLHLLHLGWNVSTPLVTQVEVRI